MHFRNILKEIHIFCTEKRNHTREKSASDNILKELLEYTATILQRHRSESLVIDHNIVEMILGFMHSCLASKKINATVQHQMEGTDKTK